MFPHFAICVRVAMYLQCNTQCEPIDRDTCVIAKRGTGVAEEDVLELVHSGVGEQRRRVVVRHEGELGTRAVAFEYLRMKAGSRSPSSDLLRLG